MLTDEQCNNFRRLPLSFNDMVREIFRSGFIAGDASESSGTIGKALKDLEDAVRADKVGCLHVASHYDDKGAWLKDRFVSTSGALDRLDLIRNTVAKAKKV